MKTSRNKAAVRPPKNAIYKTCPFCGSADLAMRERPKLNDWDEPYYSYRVACQSCRAFGPDCETEPEAARQWDRRPEGGAAR